MQELDNLADEISSVKIGCRDRPDEFWQEGEECGDDVGDGEVQHVEVSPTSNHVRTVAEDAGHDAEVAEDRHQNYASHHADLKSFQVFFLVLVVPRFIFLLFFRSTI